MKVCPICRKSNIYQKKKSWFCINCQEDIEPKEIKKDDIRSITKLYAK